MAARPSLPNALALSGTCRPGVPSPLLGRGNASGGRACCGRCTCRRGGAGAGAGARRLRVGSPAPSPAAGRRCLAPACRVPEPAGCVGEARTASRGWGRDLAVDPRALSRGADSRRWCEGVALARAHWSSSAHTSCADCASASVCRLANVLPALAAGRLHSLSSCSATSLTRAGSASSSACGGRVRAKGHSGHRGPLQNAPLVLAPYRRVPGFEHVHHDVPPQSTAHLQRLPVVAGGAEVVRAVLRLPLRRLAVHAPREGVLKGLAQPGAAPVHVKLLVPAHQVADGARMRLPPPPARARSRRRGEPRSGSAAARAVRPRTWTRAGRSCGARRRARGSGTARSR